MADGACRQLDVRAGAGMKWPPGEEAAPLTSKSRLPDRSSPHQPHEPFTERADCVESPAKDLAGASALAFGAVWLAAARGLLAPSNDELLELTGLSSLSAPNSLYGQLARKGLVAVRAFQRGRQVHVAALGKSTAPPRCRRPHWRHRGEQRRG